MDNIYYVDENDEKFMQDIVKRKEFQFFNLENDDKKSDIIPRFLLDECIKKNEFLELRSYQLFISNYLNPNTNYSRLLVKWETGMGKTIGAISIAINFINFYQKQEIELQDELQDKLQEDFKNIEMGSVFIIGFTQQIFKNELLKHPELGFISREELEEFNELKKNVFKGNKSFIEPLKKFSIMLNKRLYNRKGNGFFKFIGYKELTNHLFIEKEKNINIHSLTEDELKKKIKNKEIIINEDLLKNFSNSLLICDEIHNVYNSIEKNNWGVTLQTILNSVNSCRAVFLSATPLNNKSTEIIDLLNLLNPNLKTSIKKSDFFDENNNLLENKKSDLKKYLKGKISFIRNKDNEFMATKYFNGEEIKGIDYLKFIRCPFSKFHYKTYKYIIEKELIKQENKNLIDYVMPDPQYKNPYDNIGIFKTNDVKEKLLNPGKEWKNKFGLYYSEKNEIVMGSGLKKDSLKNISNKYYQLVKTLQKALINKKGKIFIYHNNIHNSGTLFIQEILKQNGFISEFENENDNTLCSICGKIRKIHSKKQLQLFFNKTNDEHIYKPARFIIVHSNLNKKQINQSLEKFNHINNVDGNEFMILLGSKLIKESHSINSVRNIMIMSRPDNIPTLIQIIGRAVRLNSHKMLPINERKVEINIFTSSLPFTNTNSLKNKSLSNLSYEEEKYMEKVKTYKVIQEIEKIMHETAIDKFFNYDFIWNLNKTQNNNFKLDILKYQKNKENIKYNFKPDELNLSTFNIFYAKFEIENIIYIIKKLFLEYSRIWKYDDLFNAVKNPPFDVKIKTNLFYRQYFNIAINNIIYNDVNYKDNTIKEMNQKIYNIIEKLNDPKSKIILDCNYNQFVITKIGNFYSMVPLENHNLVIDSEVIYRKPILKENEIKFDINEYLQYDLLNNYYRKKANFIKKWDLISLENMDDSICDYGVDFHSRFIEEIIEYVINIFFNPYYVKDINHDFLLKMLFVYDLYNLISWANTAKEEIYLKYKNYIINKIDKNEVKKISKDFDKNDLKKLDEKQFGLINYSISDVNKSNPQWVSNDMINNYHDKIEVINLLFDGKYTKTSEKKKIKASLVPVGHFINETPRYYDIENREWINDTPTPKEEIKENNIIIGYDSKSKDGFLIKFKIRKPFKNTTQINDFRLIEKGAVCNTKSKSFLKDIAKKLKIKIKDNINIDDLCNKIRKKLMYKEIKSRINNEKTRWFYFIYEKQNQ
jgi:hypothetical protein